MYYVLLCNVYYIEFVKFLWRFLSEISTSAFKNSPHFTGHFNRDVTEHKCIDKLGWAERSLDCKYNLCQTRLNFYKSCAKLNISRKVRLFHRYFLVFEANACIQYFNVEYVFRQSSSSCVQYWILKCTKPVFHIQINYVNEGFSRLNTLDLTLVLKPRLMKYNCWCEPPLGLQVSSFF